GHNPPHDRSVVFRAPGRRQQFVPGLVGQRQRMIAAARGFIPFVDKAVGLWRPAPLNDIDTGERATVEYLASRPIAALNKYRGIGLVVLQQRLDEDLCRERLRERFQGRSPVAHVSVLEPSDAKLADYP